eukprot:m.478633 g.478633  ORF g.478633 m.478633 type:complete len:96 (-) comp57170_c1_seq5:103-390(-)
MLLGGDMVVKVNDAPVASVQALTALLAQADHAGGALECNRIHAHRRPLPQDFPCLPHLVIAHVPRSPVLVCLVSPIRCRFERSGFTSGGSGCCRL